MAFRDDNEAQRARAHQLEAELEEAQERIRALEGAEEARARAEARIAELERAPKKETPGQRARREKDERKAQQRKARDEARKAAHVAPGAEKRLVILGIVAIIVAVAGAVLSHRESEPGLPTPDLTQQPDLHAQPSEGTVMLMLGEHRYAGASTPRFSAHALSANCEGFVSQVPTLGLTVGQLGFVAVEVAEDDALLVLQGPSGVLCDVAEGPERARVGAMLSAGAYRIWVGRRHASTSPLTHVLSVIEGSNALPDLTRGTVVIPMLPSE